MRRGAESNDSAPLLEYVIYQESYFTCYYKLYNLISLIMHSLRRILWVTLDKFLIV